MGQKRRNYVIATERLIWGVENILVRCNTPEKGYTPPILKGNGHD